MKARVLVADDSATIQKVVELALDRVGVELIQARSAEEAMRKAKEDRPDLMLIDHSMPDQSGQELCAALRQDPRLKDVPIIFMSAISHPIDEAEWRRVGATDMVTKPFESQTLIGKVKQLIIAPAPEEEVFVGAGATPGEEEFVLEGQEGFGESIRLPADVGGETAVQEEEVVVQELSGEAVPTYDLPLAEEEELPLEVVSDERFASPVHEVEEISVEYRAAALGFEAPGVRSREEQPVRRAPETVREAHAVSTGAQPLAVPPEVVEQLAREVAERVATYIVRELRGELLDRVNRLLWEVVPDLAEQLITQEIQRIRDLVEGKK